MILHVYKSDDGCDLVVAESEEDALAVWEQHSGERRCDYPDLSFEKVDDSKELSIIEEEAGYWESMSALGWARTNGRGFLSSTER